MTPSIPVISVVIPAYNAGKYIGGAIESVLRQDLSNFEIIVVNDGSIDNTLVVLSVITDSRLRVITQKNAGVSIARNTGIANATGKFIFFLDADDLLEPQAFSRCVKTMSENDNVVLVYGEAQTFVDGQKPELIHREPLFAKRPSGNVLKDIIVANCIACGSAVMVLSSSIKQTSGFSSSLRLGEDWVMWVEMATLGEFAYLPTPAICFYRQHPKSASRNLALQADEMVPAINQAYGLPAVLERYSASYLSQLRKQTMANSLCYSAQEMLKQQQWQEARTLYRQALMLRPIHLRTLILFSCALFRHIPHFIWKKLK